MPPIRPENIGPHTRQSRPGRSWISRLTVCHYAADNVAPFHGGSGLRKTRDRSSVGRTWEVPDRMPMARRPRSSIPDAVAVGTQA